MRVFYFSGTGNTKILADMCGKFFGIQSESIENKNIEPLGDEDEVMLLYPVYASAPPRIFRDWCGKFLISKNVVNVYCIVSQMCFSGDGAMVIKEYLPNNCKVVYAEHINMPNNIANFPILNIGTEKMIRRKIAKAKLKLKKTLKRLESKEYKKKGNNKFWKKLGEMQRNGFLRKESEYMKKVYIFKNCIGCGKCATVCPTKNYKIIDFKSVPQGKCTFCFRCMYKCPVRAIGVLNNKRPKAIYNPSFVNKNL